jgi:hypothetical protein
MSIVFDIETAGKRTPGAEEILCSRIDDEQKREEILSTLGLNPFFCEIVSVAMRETTQPNMPTVVFLAAAIPKTECEAMSDEHVQFRASSTGERGMLEQVCNALGKSTAWVTYNGRSFDVPVLALRCARYRLRPPVRLVTANRYSGPHLDLHDHITGFGAMWGLRGGLAGLCYLLGVPSPKGDLHGAEVGEAWERGEYFRVGKYNAADVVATEDCGRILGVIEDNKKG